MFVFFIKQNKLVNFENQWGRCSLELSIAVDMRGPLYACVLLIICALFFFYFYRKENIPLALKLARGWLSGE